LTLVERTENDFDPGSKYHIPANVPYIRFVQLFKHLLAMEQLT
jgi:peptidyl-dipeptidase A